MRITINMEQSSDFDLINFLDSDSSEDLEENLLERKSHKDFMSTTVNKVVDVQVKNHLSYEATSSVVKLMNNMPNSELKLPEDVKSIKSYSIQELDHKFFVKCEECDELVEHNTKCLKCQRILKRDSKKNNFLVYFPLEPQIRKFLHKYFDEIINYLNREHVEGVVSDIDDGLLYKQIREKNPSDLYILSLTLNADGANIFKSSSDSLWPIQLYLNFLPPAVRFLPENIVVSTLYYGRKKPNMTDLLHLIAVEIDEFSERIISMYRDNEFYNFLPVIHLLSCDLPARTELQNFIGTNGRFGCPFCYHPGIPIRNNSGRTTIRYVRHELSSQNRTHCATLDIAECVAATDIDKGSARGVKGYSPALLFDDINVIDSFPIDFMHGILLGLMKDILEIWLGKKTIPNPPYKDYKIKTVKSRTILEKRIKSLKPTSSFKRKPRSIFEIANFKASELLHLLWYYLRYAIVGLLPTRVVKHFEKLSVSTFILCKKDVKVDEVRAACEFLKQFASEFEDIYGPGAVTMNLHLLNHYQGMIFNCGPLWSYNLFGFENNIGVLKRLVCGTTDVLNQIAFKYSRSQGSDDTVLASQQNDFEAYHSKTISIKPEMIHIIENAGVVLKSSNVVDIWRRARVRGKIYTSKNANVTKSIDYFVELKDSKIGKIEFFFGQKFSPNLLIQHYEETYQNYHWAEIKPKNSFQIYQCDEIEKELLYLQAGRIEYMTNEPNFHGKLGL